MIVVLLTALLQAQSPAPATIGRAVALAASADPRFDVISEADVTDAVALDAQRQLCGAESESCASQLAGAFSANLVLFSRSYVVGNDAHVALVFTDIASASVIGRRDVTAAGDAALLTAVGAETAALLNSLGVHEGEGAAKIKLFVSNTASEVVAPGAASSTPLLIGGIASVVGGAAVLTVGGLLWADANPVLADPNAGGGDSNRATIEQTAGIGLVIVGAAAAVFGAGLVVVAMLPGEAS